MPGASINGDRVQITGVRNFDYRSRDDSEVRDEQREARLSHLIGLDFHVSYWSEGLVSHNTFLGFTLENSPSLRNSIDKRPEALSQLFCPSSEAAFAH
jgi:hypothetical protein